jgi:hypothetical protein
VISIYSGFKHFSVLIFQILVIIFVSLLQLAHVISGNLFTLIYLLLLAFNSHIYLCSNSVHIHRVVIGTWN